MRIYSQLRSAVVLVGLCGAPVLAQQSIVGEIRDAATGKALEGATIEVSTPGSSLRTTAASDSSGTFVLPGLAPGDLEVLVAKPAYREEKLDATLAPRQILVLEVLLRPQLERQSVEVTASTTAVDPGRAQTSIVLSSADLLRMPEPYKSDIPKLVAQSVPGAVEGHDNFVHLKGNELSLHQFVDGVAFLDNPHSHFTAGFSPQAIESVNVITGGMPAEFGNRLGGVLDIVTKSGGIFAGGSAALGGGTILGRDAAVEYGLGEAKWDAYFFGSGFSDGRHLNPPAEREIRDLAYGARGMLRLGYVLGDDDRLSLTATAGGVNLQLPNTTEELLAGRDALRRTRENSAILRWQHVVSPSALLTTAYYQRYISDRLVGTSDPVTPFGNGFRRTLTNGVKVDALWHAGKHNVKAGIDLAMFSLNEDMIFDPRQHDEGVLAFRTGLAPAFALSTETFPPRAFSEASLPEFQFRGRRRGGEGGFYVQDRFSPFANFTVHAGVRYDRYSLVVTDDLVSPRIGLSYRIPKAGSVIRAVYNRYFVPAPLEYVQLGSALGTGFVQEHHEDEERPERAELSFGGVFSGDGEEEEEAFFPGPVRSLRQHYFEIGLQQPLHDKVMLDVSGYHHQGRNAYENAELSNTRLFVPINFARERTWGADVSLRVKPLERAGLFGYLNYSNMTTRFLGPVTGGLPGEEAAPGQAITPAFDQRHTGSASLSYRHERSGFMIGVGSGYGSGTPAELDEHHSEELIGIRTAALRAGTPGRSFSEDAEEEEHAPLVRLPSWWKFDFWSGAPIWRSEKKSVEIQFNIQNIGNRIYGIAKESETSPVQFGSRRRISGMLRFRF